MKPTTMATPATLRQPLGWAIVQEVLAQTGQGRPADGGGDRGGAVRVSVEIPAWPAEEVAKATQGSPHAAALREQMTEARKLGATTSLHRGFGRQVAANLKELGHGG